MALPSFERKHLMGLLISIGTFILIVILYYSAIFERMELGATDYMFFFRAPGEVTKILKKGVERREPNKRARNDIVILGIDETTIRHFSDMGIQWMFPWDIHARFIRYVGSGLPRAILFDVMFLDHKEGEQEFAEAIRRSGNVFLDYPFETKYVDKSYGDQKERIAILNRIRFPVDPRDTTPDKVVDAVPPTPMLSDAARGIGFANIFAGPDNVVRTMPLVIKWNGWYYPNVDLLVVMHYFGIGAKDVEIVWGKHVRLKNLPVDRMAKPNKKREILIPIDRHGFMDINFIGGFGSFEHYPYSYLCRDGDMMKENNASLKDKIALVAAYSVTGIATDEKQTPYGANFGIELHANTINTILDQEFLIKLSDTENIIIMLVLTFILGLVLTRLSILRSLIFTAVISLLYILGSYLLFHFFNYVSALTTPVIQIGFAFTATVVYRVLTEEREKRHVRQTFSKFVSKSVVDELLKSPEKLKLGGEKKELTVLFSDIRGFTTLSERMTPEELVVKLNHYLQIMTDIVIHYDGTLDKYVGDEIMAFWGAPIPQDNHALLACRAAVEMIERLDEMNRQWRGQGLPVLDIGIGINSGPMIVGNVGSTSRMDYTLIGDNVNLGARLEGTNKIYRTHIIISEFTYEQVKDQVVVRELDLIRVKGKEKPVTIYELLDMKVV